MQSDVKEIHKWYPTETRGIQLWLVGKRDELMKGEGGLEGKRISYEDSLSMLVVVLCCGFVLCLWCGVSCWFWRRPALPKGGFEQRLS